MMTDVLSSSVTMTDDVLEGIRHPAFLSKHDMEQSTHSRNTAWIKNKYVLLATEMCWLLL